MSRLNACTPRLRRGVTLIELLVVVIILAVLGAVGIPRFTRVMRHQQFDSIARRVMEDIRLARVQAITSKASCRVLFEPDQYRYRIPEMADRDHPSRSYIAPLDGSSASVRLAAASFAGTGTLLFSTLGVPQASGSVLLGNGVEEAVITVSPTGRVTRAFQPSGTGLPVTEGETSGGGSGGTGSTGGSQSNQSGWWW